VELDDETPVPPPPVDVDTLLDVVDRVRALVVRRARRAARGGGFHRG
jgi:hypothetical protein